MFAPTRRDRSTLERVVERLPPSYVVVPFEHGPLVVGPTGAFVLTVDEPDLDTAAERVARTAAEIRAELAARLSWAPFVDALVVVDGTSARSDAALVVPARLLAVVLTAGPVVLGEDQVERIVAAVAPVAPAAATSA